MDFGETAVREVMVSRLDIDALPVTASLKDALELIQNSGHSRLPLYEEHLDNILGIIYVKDLLPYLASGNGVPTPDWRDIARKPLFVPVSKPLDDLLRIFQAEKTHLAIVVDEYGGTAGVATMEDLLEEIVGDIRDEYDQAEEDLHERLDDQTHVFDARIHLDDLSDVLNIELDLEKYDFETLGGLIFHLTGEFPEPGDEVVYEPLRMRIESTDNHRIGRVLVRIQPPPAEDKSMAV
jgi:CBS domain containing-hemolysin-like protein